jgi:hypothetical protein
MREKRIFCSNPNVSCASLKFKPHPSTDEEENNMENGNVLVSITASREKDEIVYKLDCASILTNEELEYYLEEIIKGICKWKPGLCENSTKTLKGTIRTRKKQR